MCPTPPHPSGARGGGGAFIFDEAIKVHIDYLSFFIFHHKLKCVAEQTHESLSRRFYVDGNTMQFMLKITAGYKYANI